MQGLRRDASILVISALLLFMGTSAPLAGEKILPGKIGSYGNYYDTSTEETFSGRIVELCHVPYSADTKKCCYAMRVERDDGKGIEVVYLGPKSRLDKEQLNVEEREYVCVVGSRVNIEGKQIIIANQFNQEDYAFILRNETGRHFDAEMALLPPGEMLACAQKPEVK